MRITVPHILQQGRDDCLIACMMMVLGWLKNNYDDAPSFTYDEVKKIAKWTKGGARFCNAKLINLHKRIINARVQPKFDCGPATNIGFLWDELKKGMPVIAYLKQHYDDSRLQHAVVINGLHKNKTEIHYLDPLKDEPITRNIGEFLEEWERMYRFVIHIGVTEYQTLEDYIEEEDEE